MYRGRSLMMVLGFGGSGIKGSAPPLASEAASLIEKETLEKANIEYRTRNVEYRSEVFCRF
jgi:hypothetical protein